MMFIIWTPLIWKFYQRYDENSSYIDACRACLVYRELCFLWFNQAHLSLCKYHQQLIEKNSYLARVNFYHIHFFPVHQLSRWHFFLFYNRVLVWNYFLITPFFLFFILYLHRDTFFLFSICHTLLFIHRCPYVRPNFTKVCN